jgi:BirA family transcriptional regulator, biotin operon repressor / biotin---[acetyl-CoA-carboxylase] ligase
LAEPTFQRAHFASRLATRRLGRALVLRAETSSTNDDAWDAGAAGAADGTVVIADHQARGRGREGRAWHDAPGRGLALSILLHAGGDRAAFATAPLVAGLALARGLDTLGVDAELKWPNDLLLGGRKLAGLLCEHRPRAEGTAAFVIGAGVNVTQAAGDFPPELRDHATSLWLAGHALDREAVAAAFLNALEPLWDAHQAGDGRAALEAWRARARFWGRPVSVRTPSGTLAGSALALADDGALVVRTAAGADVRVLAGDVTLDGAGERA